MFANVCSVNQAIVGFTRPLRVMHSQLINSGNNVFLDIQCVVCRQNLRVVLFSCRCVVVRKESPGGCHSLSSQTASKAGINTDHHI